MGRRLIDYLAERPWLFVLLMFGTFACAATIWMTSRLSRYTFAFAVGLVVWLGLT